MKTSHNSISRKYSRGYLMLMFLLIISFAASFMGNHLLTGYYRRTLETYLRINQLFISVESANAAAYDCYVYLKEDGLERLEECQEEMGKQIESLEGDLEDHYSRNVADCVHTVDSYMKKTQELDESLRRYMAEKGSGNLESEIDSVYQDVQKLYTFIAGSFRDIYSEKLISTQQEYESMQKISSFLGGLQGTLLILAVVISVVYSRLVLNGITRNIKKTTEFVEHIKQDVRSGERLTIHTDDEISIFAETLNGLLDLVERQMKELEEAGLMRERLKQAEIENLHMHNDLQASKLTLLQSRINPHFLFNTLNSITSYARMENADKTADLMEQTAEYLRYNLDKLTKAVKLEDEVENIKSYILIQEARFDDRFAFEIQMEDSCREQIMPCMILQPLVENSLKHGVHDMLRGGRVLTWIYPEKDRVVILVEDNGKGFSPEAIQWFYESRDNPKEDGHIGLKNIYMRLKLFYGGDVEFSIESVPGRTMIRISLPKKTAAE